MFDVNIDAYISAAAGYTSIENFNPFLVPEKSVVKINPRTDYSGYMELQAISGGPIFLFRGSFSAAEIETFLKGENPNFDLAAAVGQSACIKMEASIGELTVFSEKASFGFLRICQYPPA